ncbi:DUF3566 domain-containing protein [Streptomyces avermitilis]|uniref:DUF3566 domain-containing protein n=1 Tax=Streptomyces avermitilis TaxID=33903 RepID=UPI0033B06EDC
MREPGVELCAGAFVAAISWVMASFLLSLAVGIYMIVAVAVPWAVPAHDRRHRPGAVAVAGLGAENHRAIAVINTGLATSLATLAAFVYNAPARFVGGSELTLSEGE